MGVKTFILFVAHATGEGEDRAVVVHHLDLRPLHAGSLERRLERMGQVLATATLVEDDAGHRTIFPSRRPGEGGLSDREYAEFVASCEDWAKGR